LILTIESMTTISSNYKFHLLLDGKPTQGASSMEIINPATGETLTRCPRGDRNQLEEAVQAAKHAFSSWSVTPVNKRRNLLLALADALSARQAQFARILTEEQGKPLPDAEGEVLESVNLLRGFAGMDLSPRILQDTEQGFVVQQDAPLGVVAVITAWNFPLWLLMVKLAPALLAGNTVVAKPAPTTPLSTLLFGDLCAQVLPAGAVNVITDQNDLGDALAGHPDIAKITFTGSTQTGRRVMAQAAGTLKRLTLELGGNDPAIVMDDVNVHKVAANIFAGAMINAGQLCTAIKRVYVPVHLYESMCEELALLADRVILGDGMDASTQMGPVQNRAHFDRMSSLLASAHQEGTVVAGGSVLERPGYFVRPTVVRDIGDDARLVREEQFGPILPVLAYQTVDEAITRANDSIYGLTGTVWGRDTTQALEVAKQLECGTVWVNGHLELPIDIAVGGVKQSGLGVELGAEGLREFTQRRIVNVRR
jgi:acyl-CoA reductase-like NAD-dependent aldehyde dehydrogenase